MTVSIFRRLLPVILLAAGCAADNKEQAVPAPVVTGVTVETVANGKVPRHFLASGTVRATVAAPLAARIAGTIEAVHVAEGDRVAKGQLLVTIRSEETVSGASGARAAVEEAARGVEEAEARKVLAEQTFSRFENLFREQAVTRQEYDTRCMERDVAVQGLSRAKARLEQAREQAKGAGAMAGHTKVAAPFSGVVTGKAVERGATVFPGMPLLTVEQEGGYRFEASVPDSSSEQLRRGDAVAVTIDGLPGEQRGVISELSAVADAVSRTRTVKIDIDAKGVRSGMFGRAAIPAGTDARLTVPATAIVERGMLTSVWVVGADSIARMRLVKVGRSLGDRVEVLSGLVAGERVVTAGIEKVHEGVTIR